MDSTITAIKQQKRNPQRVSIFLDGAYAFPLAKIVAAWLKVGQRLNPSQIQELLSKDEAEKAFQRALNFLSFRPRSQAEVERNLRKHEVSETLIPAIIERLRNGNLLNDSNFARRWVEDRSAFKPRGAYALRVELRQKGVPDEVIGATLTNLDESELARQAAQRKLRQWVQLEWPDFRNKLSAYLSRRGFRHEVVVETCRELWHQMKEPQSSD
ncbi:MAG: RecX family transcriptional regulator [Chloroflexi bacterium]|nr:RecX family transcriptional regulator [Chloroflexota bacterium]